MSTNLKKHGTRRRRNPNMRRSRSERSDLGSRINPSSNPPQMTYQPWYPLTLALTHTNSLTLTPLKVVNAIRKQLDPHKHGFIPEDSRDPSLSFRLQFRILSIRSWNLTGRQIALAINDYSVRNATGQDQICGIVDSGTALHVPCVGYRLPSSLANLVLRNDNDDKNDTIADIIQPSGSSCMTYVEVHWRFDGPIALTSNFQTDMAKLLSNQKAVRGVLESTQRTIDHISQIAEQTKPSFIRKVIDGATLAAEVVTVAAGEEDVVRAERLNETLDQLGRVLVDVKLSLDKFTSSSPRVHRESIPARSDCSLSSEALELSYPDVS